MQLLAELTAGQMIGIVGGIVVLIVLLVVVAVFLGYFKLWIQSVLTGAGITIWDLLGMTFRKVRTSSCGPRSRW
jgi:uncharacterized protein YqfA (UPF0365 family)